MADEILFSPLTTSKETDRDRTGPRFGPSLQTGETALFFGAGKTRPERV